MKVLPSLLAALLLGLATAVPAAAEDLKQPKILMNWFAQADQGGFWQAMYDSTGKAAGIDIMIVAGGPRIQAIPQVASGQAEFGIANADDIAIARTRGVPVVAIYAYLDVAPYTLVYHPDPAVKTLTDLNGRPFAVALGIGYWEWLKRHFHLDKVREIPVSGDLGIFRSDKAMVQQGLFLFLPPRMRKAGIDVSQFKVADLGYRPYATLFTTERMIREHPEFVANVVTAVRAGWAGFAADPDAIKPKLLAQNTQIEPDIHDAAARELIAELLPKDRAQLGCMSDARWQELAGQLKEAALVPAGADISGSYTLRFAGTCH